MDQRELISALADGQLRGEGLARGVHAAASDEGRSTWAAYCVIGEVLRSGQATAGTPRDEFLAKLRVRMAAEPSQAVPAVPLRVQGERAANDWMWKMVAGVASVAAFGAIGWNVWGTAGTGGALPTQLASARAPVAAGVMPVSAASDPRGMAMLRDPRLDQLLAAHRQFGAAGALQSSSGFLRNATFEGPAR